MRIIRVEQLNLIGFGIVAQTGVRMSNKIVKYTIVLMIDRSTGGNYVFDKTSKVTVQRHLQTETINLLGQFLCMRD